MKGATVLSGNSSTSREYERGKIANHQCILQNILLGAFEKWGKQGLHSNGHPAESNNAITSRKPRSSPIVP